MKMSVKDIFQCPYAELTIAIAGTRSVPCQSGRRLRRGLVTDCDLRAVLDFHLTCGDHPFARFEALEYDHLAADPRPGLDRSAHRLELRMAIGVLAVLTDDVDAVAVERVLDGGLGQHHHVGLRR